MQPHQVLQLTSMASAIYLTDKLLLISTSLLTNTIHSLFRIPAKFSNQNGHPFTDYRVNDEIVNKITTFALTHMLLKRNQIIIQNLIQTSSPNAIIISMPHLS